MIEYRFAICSASCSSYSMQVSFIASCVKHYIQRLRRSADLLFFTRTNKITKANQKTGEIIQTFLLSTSSVT